MSEKIGDKTCLIRCKDCGKMFHFLEFDKWCEECFDKGLHKDMDEHFKNFVEQDLKDRKDAHE